MKQINNYSTKNAFEIKDIDKPSRKVSIYLAKFDNIDSDGDVIRKGAFSKSLKENGVDSSSNRKIAFLRHHDWTQPIGKFLELSEDSNGLFGVAQMGRTQVSEDAWKDYEDGIIREHSIGFQYIKDKMKFIEDSTLETKGYYEIKEVKLFEGSAVTFGANELTNVVSFSKGCPTNDLLDNFNKEFNCTLKALLDAVKMDEGTYEYEMKLKYLNSQIGILGSKESFLHSIKTEPLKDYGFNWSEIINKITI